MSDAFTTGLAAGYGIAIPLGAIAVLIVTTAARGSFRLALAAAAGSVLSNYLGKLTIPLHIVGGCVLLVVALRGLTNAFRAGQDTRTIGPSRSNGLMYVRFLGLTLINPLTVIYFASIVLANQTGATPTQAIAFVGGVALASASWQTVLAASGALAGRVLLNRGRIAIAFVGYGIVLALAIDQFSRT